MACGAGGGALVASDPDTPGSAWAALAFAPAAVYARVDGAFAKAASLGLLKVLSAIGLGEAAFALLDEKKAGALHVSAVLGTLLVCKGGFGEPALRFALVAYTSQVCDCRASYGAWRWC